MHYKDGTVAKIGDHVKGRLYNTTHEVAGTLVSITPGVDSCNAMVAFVEAIPLEKATGYGDLGQRVSKDMNHGSAGGHVVHCLRTDYTQLSNLELVSSPSHAYRLDFRTIENQNLKIEKS